MFVVLLPTGQPGGTMQTRYEPTTINDLQKCLDGCSDKMRVEVRGGVSLDVKTVADLRSLLVWPSGLAVVVPDERDRLESVVVVERKSDNAAASRRP
jgi:hypothetical protein